MVIQVALLSNALTYASIIALLSLGVTLTYMTTRVFNFAHPRFSLVAAYAAAIALASIFAMQGVTKIRPPLPEWAYAVALVVAVIAGAAVALIEYYLVIKPLVKLGAGYLTLMIATLGFDFILVAVLLVSSTHYSVTKVLLDVFSTTGSRLTLSGYDPVMFAAGAPIRMVFIEAMVFTIGLTLLMYLMLMRTKIGVMMRASVENPSLALVLGVNVDRVYAFAWFLAGATAGLAGYLILFGTDIIGKYITATSPSDEMIVSVFAGSIVGGVNSVLGSLGGGFLIGIVEQLLVPWTSTVLGIGWLPRYAKMFSMLAIVVTLLFIPQGLASIPETRVWKRLVKIIGRGGEEQ